MTVWLICLKQYKEEKKPKADEQIDKSNKKRTTKAKSRRSSPKLTKAEKKRS